MKTFDLPGVLCARRSRPLRVFLALAAAAIVLAAPARAAPSSPEQQPPAIDGRSLSWTPWTDGGGARLELRDGLPAVASASPVEAGFVAEVRAAGPLMLEARFEGEIGAPHAHGAHIALQNEALLVALPPGRYSPDQPFYASIAGDAEPRVRRLSFGLGGWSRGTGQLRLASLTLSPLPPPPATVDAGKYLALPLFLAVLAACAYLGRHALAAAGLPRPSLAGSGLVAGFAFLGLAQTLSLRCFGSFWPGVLLALGCLLALARRGRTALREDPVRPAARAGDRVASVVIALGLASWGLAVAATYAPLALFGLGANYAMPNIADLPKQLAAAQAMTLAGGWPPPNPFLQDEPFAYNVLFYAPQALVARIVGDPAVHLQLFGLAVLAMALGLPLVVLDLVRSMTPSPWAHGAAVWLATWVGGLTPLWVGQPAMGVRLAIEKLLVSAVWVDEVFVSAVYVPQHVCAVLCALVGVWLLARARLFWVGVCGAAGLTLAGILCSFILAPLLALTFVLATALTFAQRLRVHGRPGVRPARPWILAAVLGACALAGLPFLLDILRWGGGERLFRPPVEPAQWFYVLACFGPVAVLAPAGAQAARRDALVLALVAMAAVGLAFLLFAAYPDGGVKSGMWLRIALVPLGALGCASLASGGSRPARAFATTAVAGACVAVTALNAPIASYLVPSGWHPMEPGLRSMIEQVRALPRGTRVAMLSSEQAVASLMGRAVDYNFFPLRGDAYLPPESRGRALRFWRGVEQGEAGTWESLSRRYDVIVTPMNVPAAARMAARFKPSWASGGYLLYHLKQQPHV